MEGLTGPVGASMAYAAQVTAHNEAKVTVPVHALTRNINSSNNQAQMRVWAAYETGGAF
jgi:hypothetical protein